MECCKGLAPEQDCACSKSRIAELEAALNWVGEVQPERMRYDCVRIEITRDQWNAIRRAMNMREMPKR
jgi:hypothetical protein